MTRNAVDIPSSGGLKYFPYLNTSQVWNAHAERKKIDTGDSYVSSLDRAELVPEAARVLREQGQHEMANILDNTTEGARKVTLQEATGPWGWAFGEKFCIVISAAEISGGACVLARWTRLPWMKQNRMQRMMHPIEFRWYPRVCRCWCGFFRR